MRDQIRRFIHEEDGASMAEYALMLALVLAVAGAAWGTLGENVNDALTDANAAFN